MLTPIYQAKYGGLHRFTSFWDTTEIVGINTIDAVVTNPSASLFTIRADLYYGLADGGSSSEIVEIDESGNGGSLLINDYRFISSY